MDENKEELVPYKNLALVIRKWIGFSWHDVKQNYGKDSKDEVHVSNGNSTNLFNHLKKQKQTNKNTQNRMQTDSEGIPECISCNNPARGFKSNTNNSNEGIWDRY